MAPRYWPLERGHIITSGFGARWGTSHRGIDFGWNGGSAGRPVYAAQGGTVQIRAYNAPANGPGSGFGWWLGIDHPTEDGSGFTVYGHIVPEVALGDRVEAGQRIGHINPDRSSNGDVDPHCHFEVHPTVWRAGSQIDPTPWLTGSLYPGERPAAPPAPASDNRWTLALEQLIGPLK